jgi:hypothetical protein
MLGFNHLSVKKKYGGVIEKARRGAYLHISSLITVSGWKRFQEPG